MRLESDERVAYAQAVWGQFEKRRGYEGEMSSAEFDLICKWMSREIPLPVALRGIQETGGKPRTLHACIRSVDGAFAYWQRAAGINAEPVDEWSAERAEEERKRIMAQYRRAAGDVE